MAADSTRCGPRLHLMPAFSQWIPAPLRTKKTASEEEAAKTFFYERENQNLKPRVQVTV